MTAYDEPPERAAPPADGEQIEFEIGRGECHECDEEHGPTHAEDIGHWARLRHMECRDVDVETWTETYEWSEEAGDLVKVSNDE